MVANDPMDDPNNPAWDRMALAYGRLSEQQSLFPDVAPTVNPAADLPRVPCGNDIPVQEPVR